MNKYNSNFEHFIHALQNAGDITLSYYFQKKMIKKQLLDRQIREQLKREIIEELIPHVSAVFDELAIKQLNEMLNNLGK